MKFSIFYYDHIEHYDSLQFVTLTLEWLLNNDYIGSVRYLYENNKIFQDNTDDTKIVQLFNQYLSKKTIKFIRKYDLNVIVPKYMKPIENLQILQQLNLSNDILYACPYLLTNIINDIDTLKYLNFPIDYFADINNLNNLLYLILQEKDNDDIIEYLYDQINSLPIKEYSPTAISQINTKQNIYKPDNNRLCINLLNEYFQFNDTDNETAESKYNFMINNTTKQSNETTKWLDINMYSKYDNFIFTLRKLIKRNDQDKIKLLIKLNKDNLGILTMMLNTYTKFNIENKLLSIIINENKHKLKCYLLENNFNIITYTSLMNLKHLFTKEEIVNVINKNSNNNEKYIKLIKIFNTIDFYDLKTQDLHAVSAFSIYLNYDITRYRPETIYKNNDIYLYLSPPEQIIANHINNGYLPDEIVMKSIKNNYPNIIDKLDIENYVCLLIENNHVNEVLLNINKINKNIIKNHQYKKHPKIATILELYICDLFDRQYIIDNKIYLNIFRYEFYKYFNIKSQDIDNDDIPRIANIIIPLEFWDDSKLELVANRLNFIDNSNAIYLHSKNLLTINMLKYATSTTTFITMIKLLNISYEQLIDNDYELIKMSHMIDENILKLVSNNYIDFYNVIKLINSITYDTKKYIKEHISTETLISDAIINDDVDMLIFLINNNLTSLSDIMNNYSITITNNNSTNIIHYINSLDNDDEYSSNNDEEEEEIFNDDYEYNPPLKMTRKLIDSFCEPSLQPFTCSLCFEESSKNIKYIMPCCKAIECEDCAINSIDKQSKYCAFCRHKFI